MYLHPGWPGLKMRLAELVAERKRLDKMVAEKKMMEEMVAERKRLEEMVAERQRLEEVTRLVVERMKGKEVVRLLALMDEKEGQSSNFAKQEVLRRIGQSDQKECLEVLQETVKRGDLKFQNLEDQALEVMTRSYSYFSETLWTQFAIKTLDMKAFTKLATAAKKAKTRWDESDYGGVHDPNDSNSEDEYGQLSDGSFQEDFKAILSWVEREDVDIEKRNLVTAVFKTKVRKSRCSVIRWMKKKVENWERKEREEEEETRRIEEEVAMDRAMGIPFTCGIPGPYGQRLDDR